MTWRLNFLSLALTSSYPRFSLSQLLSVPLLLKPVECVRNLGAWFDIHMSMDTHVSKFVVKLFMAYIPSGKWDSFFLWFTPLSCCTLTTAILLGIPNFHSTTGYRRSLMLLLGWFVLFQSLTISLLFWLNCTVYLSISEFNSRFFYLFSRR